MILENDLQETVFDQSSFYKNQIGSKQSDFKKIYNVDQWSPKFNSL